MNRILKPFGVVLAKELVDGLRDRRSIASALVPLLIMPVMALFAFQTVSKQAESARDIKVPVVGREHAGPLIQWLEQQPGVELETGPDDPEGAVREGDMDLVLVIPEDFGHLFARSKTAEVRVVVDSSDIGAGRAASRLRSLVRRYGQQIALQRLIVRGVSPEVIQPIDIESTELSSNRERAARAFTFIPMFLLIVAFVGGLQIAIDSTAGERERGSLEPLLANPVPPVSIVGGKWLAAVAFACVSMGLTAGMLMLVLEFSPLRRLGTNLELGLPELGSMLAAALPLALPASAFQMSIATLARSYKEAQTYVSMLTLVPMLPMIVMTVSPFEETWWTFAMPVLGQQVLIQELISGNAPEPLRYWTAGLSAVAATIPFLWLIARQFRREKIVFGR